jgi:hypothetical protein
MAKAKQLIPASEGDSVEATQQQPGEQVEQGGESEPLPAGEAPVSESTPSVSLALVRARVLVEGAFGKPNDVVEVGEADVTANPGTLDADPSAVAYAESLAE